MCTSSILGDSCGHVAVCTFAAFFLLEVEEARRRSVGWGCWKVARRAAAVRMSGVGPVAAAAAAIVALVCRTVVLMFVCGRRVVNNSLASRKEVGVDDDFRLLSPFGRFEAAEAAEVVFTTTAVEEMIVVQVS